MNTDRNFKFDSVVEASDVLDKAILATYNMLIDEYNMSPESAANCMDHKLDCLKTPYRRSVVKK